MYKQAKWNEPIIFNLGHKDRRGQFLPKVEEEIKELVGEVTSLIPKNMLSNNRLRLPELSEVEVVRHYIRLSEMNYGVDSGIYPLGSCTMKYNPKINEVIANSSKINLLHPYQNEKSVQGILEILYKLEKWLAKLTGTHTVSLQPSAGAHGEFLGTLIIKKHHESKHHHTKTKRENRCEIIIPDSAHGTNPASAAMALFNVVVVPTGDDGCINLSALKSVVSDKTAGLMLTNPNTLGIFEENICEIAEIIHSVGGLLYYDGANLNPILCKVRPGDMGFDIVHINIHKTFGTPHGGGGPGSGPVGVTEELSRYLPVPRITYNGEKYGLDYNYVDSLKKIRSFYGNITVLLKAYAYLLSLGFNGLKAVAEVSVLNANYLMRKIEKIKGLKIPYDGTKPRKHEFVISAKKLKADTGITVLDISKRLLDYGVHSPTIYFPSIVEEALMIEPTETIEKKELDHFVEVLTKVCSEAYTNPDLILNAPNNTSLSRLDEVKASRPKSMILSWRMYQKKKGLI